MDPTLVIVAIIVLIILWRVFGRSRRTYEPVMLNGGRKVEVVGESFHQAALNSLAGGRTREGVQVEVVATLMAEPTNKHDRNAVAIVVDGQMVGYLARAMAKNYGPMLRKLADEGRVGQCSATIVGGWDRGHFDKGDFGIWLDLATPAKAIP